MSDTELDDFARCVIDTYREKGWTIATVESCTGGLIAAALTNIPGSSAVLDRGFVTYSNGAKSDLVGVDPDAIEAHGAVSEIVAREMAIGGRKRSRTDVCVSVTGVAGPGGGTATKPVGLVHFAIATDDGVRDLEERFGEIGRAEVRRRSVLAALRLLKDAIANA